MTRTSKLEQADAPECSGTEIRQQTMAAYRMLEQKLRNQSKAFDWSTEQSFLSYGWRNFDVKFVLSLLVNPRQSFYPHKEVLYSGLWAFVISFGDMATVRSAMMLTILDAVQAGEASISELYENEPHIGELAFRLSSNGHTFYREIYDPIGGLRRLVRSKSNKQYKKSIEKFRLDVEKSVDLMRAIHYISQITPSDEVRQVSFNKLSSMFADKNGFSSGNRVSKRKMDQLWLKSKPILPLLYAASVEVGASGETLLHRLLTGRPRYGNHYHLMTRVVGRAQYVAKHLLGAFPANSSAHGVEALLPDVTPEAVPSPTLSDHQLGLINKAFRKQK